MIDDRGDRGHALDRTLNVFATAAITKACACIRKVSIDGQPLVRLEVVIEFKAGATASTARVFSSSFVADIDDLGSIIQLEHGERGLQAIDDLGAHTDLLPEGSYQAMGPVTGADSDAACIV